MYSDKQNITLGTSEQWLQVVDGGLPSSLS